MKIRAQIGMVLNLDKCIGCHTCSVTCKNVWTNRPGMEYGAINLGPVPELIDASGTQWRLFIELAYNAASGSGRRGNVTRRFILDCVL